MQQNTCLSTTIYRRWSLVPLQRQERFLCADFSNGLQTVNTNWNSLWKRWLPDFSWRPVRGGLCGNEEFEKAQAKIQHGTYHIGAGSPWIEMLVEGEVVRINTGRRAARASASSSGSSWPRSSTSRSGQVGNCATPCKEARRHAAACAHVDRQTAYADSAPRSASWKNANGVSQMVPSDWSGRIRTRELEEEALKNDWTIETNQGGHSTAISRMDHTTGATKI